MHREHHDKATQNIWWIYHVQTIHYEIHKFNHRKEKRKTALSSLRVLKVTGFDSWGWETDGFIVEG